MSHSHQGRGGRPIQQPYRTPDDFDREAIKKEIYEGIKTCSDEYAELCRKLHQSSYNKLSKMSARDLRKYGRYENLFRSETVLAALKEREQMLQSSLENPQNDTEVSELMKEGQQARKELLIEASTPESYPNIDVIEPPTNKQKKKKKKHNIKQDPIKKTPACHVIQSTGEFSSDCHTINTSPSTSNLVTTAILPEEKNNSKQPEIPVKEVIVRSIKVLIRGIPAETATDEISLEIGKKGLKIHKTIQFTKREGVIYRPLPLFLVILPELSNYKEIYALKFYKQYPVEVERFRGSRELLQCFRCQGFNHSPRTCTASPRCMKCAGEHLSYQCTNSRDTPAKCCNCQQNHTSNFSGCEARPRRKHNSKPTLVLAEVSSASRLVNVIKELKELVSNEDVTKILKTIVQEIVTETN